MLDQLVEARIGIALGMGESVELLERQRGAVLQDALRPLDPVGQLAGDEVPDDVVRAPAVLGDVGRIGPGVGQAASSARSRSGVRRSRFVASPMKSLTG